MTLTASNVLLLLTGLLLYQLWCLCEEGGSQNLFVKRLIGIIALCFLILLLIVSNSLHALRGRVARLEEDAFFQETPQKLITDYFHRDE